MTDYYKDRQQMTDEWGLLEILKNHNAVGALTEIEDKLNKFANTYLQGSDSIKKSERNELKCYLQLALIDSENGKCTLRDRIEEIVEAIK